MIAPLAIPAEVANYLEYDPLTGICTWSSSLNSRSAVGSVAGSLNRTGYLAIKFRGVAYQLHRVIWFLMTGEQPREIDHIDRDKANNRWTNLRNTTHALNSRNRAGTGRYSRGVVAHGRRFKATIWHEGKRRHLGVFDTEAEAAAAYDAAAKSLMTDAETMSPVSLNLPTEPDDQPLSKGE